MATPSWALLDLLGVDPQQGLGRVAEAGGDRDGVVAVSQGSARRPVAQVVQDHAARSAGLDPGDGGGANVQVSGEK